MKSPPLAHVAKYLVHSRFKIVAEPQKNGNLADGVRKIDLA